MSDQRNQHEEFFEVVWETDDLLVVDKRPGVLTMGQSPNEPSVLAGVRSYLTELTQNVDPFIAIIGRLDVPVSGLLLIAKHSACAQLMWTQQRQRDISKRYVALVEGSVEPDEQVLVDWIVKHRRHRRVTVVSEATEAAQAARLTFRVVARWPAATGLEIKLQTGRKHQIRAQLAHHGHPIRGDRKYGGKPWAIRGIALCCQRLTLVDPRNLHQRLVFERPEPWEFWRSSNGLAPRDSWRESKVEP